MKQLFEDKRRLYLLILLVTIAIVILWAILTTGGGRRREIVEYQRPDWAQGLPQNPDNIVDIKEAFPYSGKYFTILQTDTADIYRVEYAPYLTRADIKPLIEDFMRTYDLTKMTIIWDDDSSFPQETFDLTETHD